LRTELGQDRQVELARERVDRRRPVRESDGHHPRAADGIEHRAQVGGGDFVIEGAEVQAERGTLEQGGGRSDPLRQLGLECIGVGAADPHLRQAHLAESDLECWLLHDSSGIVHRCINTPNGACSAPFTRGVYPSSYFLAC
jgi:hypothetical protein